MSIQQLYQFKQNLKKQSDLFLRSEFQSVQSFQIAQLFQIQKALANEESIRIMNELVNKILPQVIIVANNWIVKILKAIFIFQKIKGLEIKTLHLIKKYVDKSDSLKIGLNGLNSLYMSLACQSKAYQYAKEYCDNQFHLKIMSNEELSIKKQEKIKVTTQMYFYYCGVALVNFLEYKKALDYLLIAKSIDIQNNQQQFYEVNKLFMLLTIRVKGVGLNKIKYTQEDTQELEPYIALSTLRGYQIGDYQDLINKYRIKFQDDKNLELVKETEIGVLIGYLNRCKQLFSRIRFIDILKDVYFDQDVDFRSSLLKANYNNEFWIDEKNQCIEFKRPSLEEIQQIQKESLQTLQKIKESLKF